METVPAAETKESTYKLITNDVVRTVDIHAHIADLDCRIEANGDNAKAIISFDNLGYGTVTAIKLKARGFNAFEDPVVVGNSDQFTIIIQDFEVAPNSKASNLVANLPNGEIRRLELEEHQICLEDGSVLTCEGSCVRDFVVQEIDEKSSSPELIDILHRKFGPTFRYKPIGNSEGWFCGCGRLNEHDAAACSLCGSSKDEMFKAVSEESFDDLLMELSLLVEKEKEEEIANRQAKAAKKKKMVKYGIIGGIALLVIIVAMIFASSYLSRQHFSSEDAMKAAISGVYTQDVSYEGAAQLKIGNGKLIERLDKRKTDLDIEYAIRSYDPGNGTFITDGGLEGIVLSNGNIEFSSWTYKKGGDWLKVALSGSSSTSGAKYESAYTALSISGSVSNTGSGYTYYNGTIKNTGSKTYRFVEVKGSFKDRSGNVLDTDWTYAVGSEGLSPGESKTFTLSIKKNSSVKDCSVSILDYQ